MNLDQVRIIAHRGNSRALPENTMAAFRSAVMVGAHMVEADVRLSREGVPVVIHDADVSRTTTAQGPVSSLHEDQLRKLGVPALEEVLTLAIAVNVEVKAEAAIPAILELVHGRTDVIVSSLDVGALEFLRQLSPELRLAFLSGEADCEAVLSRAHEAGAYAFNPPASCVSPRLVEQAHAAGLRIMPFTVNDVAEAKRFFGWGVDAMFTDDPASMLAIL
ncbi:MAG TPA: glycerophosphodiester phosphodiesterase family protein [Chloroflexota bacterium]|nr:glycerophosphodiester phosphodiesterase family protein [Chloroflexota bacterium]